MFFLWDGRGEFAGRPPTPQTATHTLAKPIREATRTARPGRRSRLMESRDCSRPIGGFVPELNRTRAGKLGSSGPSGQAPWELLTYRTAGNQLQTPPPIWIWPQKTRELRRPLLDPMRRQSEATGGTWRTFCSTSLLCPTSFFRTFRAAPGQRKQRAVGDDLR